jgi:hypothetical protein
MRNEIDKYQDIMDSRDIIEKLEEMQDEWESLVVDVEEAETEKDKEKAQTALDEWNEEYSEELAALRSFCEEAEGYSEDWKYGATLIRDSYFSDYAIQFAEDIGAIKDDATWPNTCIDWDQAAKELQMDYSAVEFDGITYWVR